MALRAVPDRRDRAKRTVTTHLVEWCGWLDDDGALAGALEGMEVLRFRYSWLGMAGQIYFA